jgi:hypothetical protein
MATKFRFPPSARDFALARAIDCEGLSTWQAAKRFGISQMRVRQIQARVADWTAEVLPPQMEAEAAARLRYAEHLASDRLEHHYQETMEQWRATHQTRFLMQAMRVALAAGKLAAPSGRIEALAADAIEGPLADWESGVGDRESAIAASDPPEEDFSVGDESMDQPVIAREGDSRASPERRELLELLRAAPRGASDALSERTRSLLSPAGVGAITQIRITPEQPGASLERVLAPTERPLTRQERRRLQKKLKRAKGLAG